MFKQIITLAAAIMLIFAAGCQSQEASEKKTEPAAENEQKPAQNDQAEEPAKEETPDQGTTAEEEPAPEQEEPAAPADGETNSETEEPAQGEPAEEEPAHEEGTHYVSPFEMRDEISIGLTKEEAEDVLQNTQPVEVTTEDGKALRYDYMPQDGYKSAAADPDVEGIKAGKLEAQVFIYYTPENTVERFRIYHKTEDGKAIEYRDEGNGEGTENILN